MALPASAVHGVALTERVIARVEADPSRPVLDYAPWAGPWRSAPSSPLPAGVLDGAVFPSGRPLPPSLRRWLAFDSELLCRFGWFGPAYGFTPRTLGQLAREEFGDGWGACYEPLSARFDECFLLPGGSDSRRVLATGAVDEYGEYPVFALDIDDLPCIELMYPGLDVYLADTAGLVTRAGHGYSALADDPAYGPRMRAHARQVFAGELAQECLG
ncbi:hypothetical protein C9F11_42410 [Streptomyces sp. YIM 121038]|uniref:hypothetical protein n=1 Tax=Streptomyces sp. YIM 121038 TaxID=2136401 RepID=UPI001110DCA6|nr:hypothetical protein [Streptomyces sp. YIM 121038]QCX73757.1 hypothetical protein C9F11_00270 [Streptomyces sp. YIM 121038]QCX82062.1 hypothetical protein C9F11_42410 [Streptomyces sp. YIM 121038]